MGSIRQWVWLLGAWLLLGATTASAAVTFRSASSTPLVQTTVPVAVNKPGGVTQGDVMLLTMFSDTPGLTLSITGGWTLIQSASNPVAAWVYYRRAGAAEPVNYTVSWGGALIEIALGVVTYSGVTAVGSPVDALSERGNASQLQMVGSSLTPTAAPDLLVFLASDDNGGAAATGTPPGGMTERLDVEKLYAADMPLPDLSPTGDKTATLSTACPSSVFLLALLAAGQNDGGSADAGAGDAGVGDGGVGDAGSAVDAGADAGRLDAGLDSGTEDGGPGDGGSGDGGFSEQLPWGLQVGCGCGSSGPAAVEFGAAALVLGLRIRRRQRTSDPRGAARVREG